MVILSIVIPCGIPCLHALFSRVGVMTATFRSLLYTADITDAVADVVQQRWFINFNIKALVVYNIRVLWRVKFIGSGCVRRCTALCWHTVMNSVVKCGFILSAFIGINYVVRRTADRWAVVCVPTARLRRLCRGRRVVWSLGNSHNPTWYFYPCTRQSGYRLSSQHEYGLISEPGWTANEERW